jgi:hypothetical protein
MARQYYVNGETLTLVKGRSDCAIGTLSELGLCQESISITVQSEKKPIIVDAYGSKPPETQFFGAMAACSFTLVNFDPDVLAVCLQESWGSSPAEGQLGHAGSLMGNGKVRFAPGGILGNHFIGLNIQSALGADPWRFLFSYLADNPIEWPVGTEKSLVRCSWEAVPYSVDPWNGGNGSFSVPIWDHTLDT